MAMIPSDEKIPRADIDRALETLKAITPAPLSITWDYLDASTSVLFVLRVADQTESSVRQTYFGQVVPRLSELIPESDDPLRWMVLFQDSTGHLITSCGAMDGGAI